MSGPEYDPFDESTWETTSEEKQKRKAERDLKCQQEEAKIQNIVGNRLERADCNILEDKDKLLSLINQATPDFWPAFSDAKGKTTDEQINLVPDRFMYDADVMLALVQKANIEPHKIDIELATNMDFVLKAITHHADYHELTDGIAKYNKKQFAIDAMRANPLVFDKLTQHKDVPEVAFEKLKHEPKYFDQIPPTLRANKEFVLQVVEYFQQHPIERWTAWNILRDSDKTLQCDKDVVKAIVTIDPLAIEHASTRLRNDPEIVELASRRLSDNDLDYFTRHLGKDIQAEIGNTDVRKYFRSKALYEQLSNQLTNEQKVEQQHSVSKSVTKAEPKFKI